MAVLYFGIFVLWYVMRRRMNRTTRAHEALAKIDKDFADKVAKPNRALSFFCEFPFRIPVALQAVLLASLLSHRSDGEEIKWRLVLAGSVVDLQDKIRDGRVVASRCQNGVAFWEPGTSMLHLVSKHDQLDERVVADEDEAWRASEKELGPFVNRP